MPCYSAVCRNEWPRLSNVDSDITPTSDKRHGEDKSHGQCRFVGVQRLNWNKNPGGETPAYLPRSVPVKCKRNHAQPTTEKRPKNREEKNLLHHGGNPETVGYHSLLWSCSGVAGLLLTLIQRITVSTSTCEPDPMIRLVLSVLLNNQTLRSKEVRAYRLV